MEQKEIRELARAQKQQELKERKETRQVERQLQEETKAIAIATIRPRTPTAGYNRPVVVPEDDMHAEVVELAVGRPLRARRAPKHLEGYELA